ncbi:MAG: metallophosphoesterase [Reyranella sp.]|nr:metallophosphoesterase [Reyranella sp.]
MRVFAVSDIHIDFPENAAWFSNLSREEYQDDVLILAGDVSHSLEDLDRPLTALARCFAKVFYVPGNHELWVIRDLETLSSLEKFQKVRAVAEECGASTRPQLSPEISIVPLFGWYDYSFGEPGPELKERWADYLACKWPPAYGVREITSHFIQMNDSVPTVGSGTVITFSHFLPRIDVMPDRISERNRFLYPILGSSLLDRQIRRIGASIHLYGHSHVNNRTTIDGITYINNAFGYPAEEAFASRRLLCIYDDEGIERASP